MSDQAVSLTIYLEDPSAKTMFDLVKDLTRVGLNIHAETPSTVSLHISRTDEVETEKSDKDSYDEAVSLLVTRGVPVEHARNAAQLMRESRILRET